MSQLLVLAWGNPSRGDDALGPTFAECAKAELAAGIHSVEFQTDFQLQPEHATDLKGRDVVLFVDASTTCQAPFTFTSISLAHDPSFTTHAMSPAALLAAYHDAFRSDPPPAYLLAIRGEHFVLGEPLSATAIRHLDAAVAFFIERLARTPTLEWNRLAHYP